MEKFCTRLEPFRTETRQVNILDDEFRLNADEVVAPICPFWFVLKHAVPRLTDGCHFEFELAPRTCAFDSMCLIIVPPSA